MSRTSTERLRRPGIPARSLSLACVALAGCGDAGTGPFVEGTQPEYASVVAGLRHTCALDVAGYAYCWGFNGQGELGVPPGADVGLRPEPLTRELRFVALAAGGSFTCGLTDATDVYCWGWPPWGLLPRPTRLGTEVAFRRIASGSSHVCGVALDDSILCWGRGSEGQLGNGRVGADADEDLPVAVAGPVGAGLVSGGATSSCALDAVGATWCWGAHDAGQLGLGAVDPGPCSSDGTPFPCVASATRVQGAPPLVDLSAGAFHVCGVDADGGLTCWGDDGDGQIADMAGAEVCSWAPPAGVDRPCSRVPVSVRTGDRSLVRVYSGGFHSCGLTADGSAYCWGADFLGQLGFGGGPVPDGPLPVYGDLRWRELALGQAHSCGVTLDGEAYCWGDGQFHQLGSGTELSPTPVRVLPVSHGLDP